MESHGTARVVAGRYRVDARIGTGAMGTVWRGYDEMLHRVVAVKEVAIPFGMAAPDAEKLRERYLREARAAARLRHPGVVGVYDVISEEADDNDDDAGRVWIVMEFVEAQNLASLLRERRLTTEETAHIGLQLLAALTAAHQAGVLHRDVKPANVLVQDDEEGKLRVTLTDFGVASISGDSSLTRTGQLVGSPAYLSPERLSSTGVAGPPSDLWALGCTLYAALEGHPPFRSTDQFEVISSITIEPVPAPKRAGNLEPILAGLLEKDPRRRWDASRARRALQDVQAGKAIENTGTWGASPTAPTSPAIPPKPPVTPITPHTTTTASTTRKGTEYRARRTRWKRNLTISAIVAAIVVVAVLLVHLFGRWPSFADANSDTRANSEITPMPEATRFYNSSFPYSMDRPKSWSANCERPLECEFSPPKNEPVSGQLRILVIVESAPGSDAEELTRKENSRNKRDRVKYEEISLDKATFGDHKGWLVEYSFMNANGTVRHVRVFRMNGANNLVYSISLNADARDFPSYEYILTAAITSFKESGPAETR
ncbi:MAG: protein kinase [Corynebacteriales bacterium]|nr:protein kinase [Mycobacteriales bacterium]